MTDDLTPEQLAQIEAIKAMVPSENPPQVENTPETPQVEIENTVEPVEPVEVHPATGIIQEIETHLANIPMFGYSETQIRKLVASLKALF